MWVKVSPDKETCSVQLWYSSKLQTTIPEIVRLQFAPFYSLCSTKTIPINNDGSCLESTEKLKWSTKFDRNFLDDLIKQYALQNIMPVTQCTVVHTRIKFVFLIGTQYIRSRTGQYECLRERFFLPKYVFHERAMSSGNSYCMHFFAYRLCNFRLGPFFVLQKILFVAFIQCRFLKAHLHILSPRQQLRETQRIQYRPCIKRHRMCT